VFFFKNASSQPYDSVFFFKNTSSAGVAEVHGGKSNQKIEMAKNRGVKKIRIICVICVPKTNSCKNGFNQ
jgi:hypothetical protein